MGICNVSSGDNDDDSVSVAVISGAVVGTLLLTIVIIIIILVVIMILCRMKKSRRSYNTDDKDVTIKLPQQYPHVTSGQSQHDSNALSYNNYGLQGLKLILQLD